MTAALQRGFLLWLLLSCSLATLAAPVQVEVRALFNGRALLEIDGESKLLRVGERYKGVILVTASSREAVVNIEDELYRLNLSRRIATRYQPPAASEVRLAPGRGGHYITPARINSQPVTVMVDTGATAVAMNLPQAKALGIDYRNGQKVPISTANGYVNGYLVMLRQVSVGTVTVENVEALVHIGDFPDIILLGNSYLSRVKMHRDNGVLVLQSQY